MKYYYMRINDRDVMLYARTNNELDSFKAVTRISADFILKSAKKRLFLQGCLQSVDNQFLTKKGKIGLIAVQCGDKRKGLRLSFKTGKEG
ncbi:MAG: hypothetical protein IT212_12850 [Bacteroidia bacterium]|nr:hypothetical protein [Bacteroidia bacterium]